MDDRHGPVQEILLFSLLGLGAGALIAGVALGIVVTYRGSGYINLAAGAIAMLAGFMFWALRTGSSVRSSALRSQSSSPTRSPLQPER